MPSYVSYDSWNKLLFHCRACSELRNGEAAYIYAVGTEFLNIVYINSIVQGNVPFRFQHTVSLLR